MVEGLYRPGYYEILLPLLINNTILAEEILKIQRTNVDLSNSINLSSFTLDLLLKWIQDNAYLTIFIFDLSTASPKPRICEQYDYMVDNFSSLLDGKAIWCLLDYYFRKELCCSHSPKESHDSRSGESIMSANNYTDAVHNFILSQKLITLLGNFPEILQISDILEHSGAISEGSVVVLLVFLASQLTANKAMDQLNFHKLLCCKCQSPERRHSSTENRVVSLKAVLEQEEIDCHSGGDAARKFKAIKAWWQDMAERNNIFIIKPATSTLQHSSTSKSSANIQRENAATLIQSHLRKSIARHNFLKTVNSVLLLQSVIRAWLMVKKKSALYEFSIIMVQGSIHEKWKRSEQVGRYVKFIVD
ncbi:hypothetical protein GH714_000847 [Hevea brasiliensis]|uniref:Uncharacterized protein n=1 Tax=Hevea brasiliensis TaxID=3981 RepID=A0A6A6LU35_HEVBR|nr:hypothetical protein GH714_000847 [Hevea brasiliensis]